jgi:hypothetical protein
MARNQSSGVVPSGAVGGQGMGPVIVVGLVALVLNLAVTGLSAAGFKLFIPFNIIGGFSYNLDLRPVVTAFVVGVALRRYGGVSQAQAWVATLLLFVVPVVVSFIVNYGTGVLLNNLSNAMVTNASNFYGILFLKSAFSAASVLLVAAFYAPALRGWPVWGALIIVWAGGDTLLFFLFRNQVITRDVYQWLYPIERTLGFMVIAYQLQRPARLAA